MNDEIKEILIKDFNEILVKEFCTDWKEKRIYIELLVNSTPFTNLLDYITNLQKENKHLSKSYAEAILFNQKRCEQNKELKQRIDKAIEYIKKEDELYYIKVFCRDLLKILNGGDE